MDGLDARFEVVNLSAGDFLRTSVEDDWTAVRIGASHLERWGGLELEQHAVEVGEHVNIIQHPAGGPKQVSLSAGAVAYVGAGRVQYLTDTMPGSSGSPVFNEKWKLIALHHAGGWLPEPNSLQKNTFFRNEGIAIAKVIKGLL